MFAYVNITELTRPYIFTKLKIFEGHRLSKNYRFFNNVSLIRLLLDNTIKFELASFPILTKCTWVMNFHGDFHVSIPTTPKTLNMGLFTR